MTSPSLNRIAILTLLVALGGCSTISKKECVSGDWYSIGYSDGAAGYESEKVHSHRDDCEKHGVGVNLNEYQRGHNDGLAKFCTRENGFKQGNNGWNIKEICPKPLEKTFFEGYLAGIKSAKERAESELKQAKWRHRQRKQLLKQEQNTKKQKALSKSVKGLERDVERRFKEVQKLQELQHKADFYYHRP